jgi:ribosomal protein L34
MKRMATHGLTTRLQSRGGKQILWRKLLQGKKGYVTLVAAP